MEKLKKRISPLIFNKLIEANYTSLERILICDKNHLSNIINLDLETTKRIIKEVTDLSVKTKFCRASQIQDWTRLSTGCLPINSITRGGIPTNRIVEIFGSSGVGKTQICLQLALMVQLPESLGGLGKGAVYICTEDVFPCKRLHELSKAFQVKYSSILRNNFEDNIYIEHIADFEHLNRSLFVYLPKLLATKNIGLIVIDSITGVFRSENVNVNYANRSQDLINFVAKLIKLSNRYQFAIITVNQVTDNTATGKSEPCLGLAWSNLVTCRFKISRFSESKVREFEVVFAPDLPQASCKFTICEDGLYEV